jgi:hypothetical protein
MCTQFYIGEPVNKYTRHDKATNKVGCNRNGHFEFSRTVACLAPSLTLTMQILYDGNLTTYPFHYILPRTNHGSAPCLDQKPGLISENAL